MLRLNTNLFQRSRLHNTHLFAHICIPRMGGLISVFSHCACLPQVRRVCYTWSGLEVLPDTFGKSAIQLLLDEERGQPQPRVQPQGRGGEGHLLETQSIRLERTQPG